MVRVIEEFLEAIAYHKELGVDVVDVIQEDARTTKVIVKNLFKSRATVVFSAPVEELTPDATFMCNVKQEFLRGFKGNAAHWVATVNQSQKFMTAYAKRDGSVGFRHTMLFGEGSAELVLKTLMRFWNEVENFVVAKMRQSHVNVDSYKVGATSQTPVRRILH